MNSKSISLRKNFTWIFFANLFFSFSQWGILISIARFGNVEMVGQYTLGLAIISPIIMLTSLKTSTIYITDQTNKYSFKDYFSIRIVTSFITAIILFALLFIVDYDTTTMIVILLVVSYKIIESISDILYAPMQKEEHVNYVAISKIVKGALSLLLISTLLYLTGNLIIGLVGVVFVYFVALVFYDFRNALKFEFVKFQFILPHFYNIVKISLPLGIVHMLISLNTNIPRYFVEYYFNAEILGYFAAISYMVVNNINIFTTALSRVVIPRFSKLLHNNKTNEVRKLLRKFEFIGIMLGVISIGFVFLFGESLLTIIYGSEYGNYTNIFKILILSTIFIFVSSFHSYFITSARYFNIQPLLGIIWVMSSTILGFVLIPKFGIEGVAYSVVLVSIIQLLSRYILLQKIFRDLRHIDNERVKNTVGY